MAWCVDDGVGSDGAAFVIEADSDFRHFEVERASFEAALAQGCCHFPAFADEGDESRLGAIGGGFSIKNGLGLFVGEFGA